MPIELDSAYQKIADFAPNPMQEEMFGRIASGDCAALLKAPTGSGKTEAVLVPALAGLLNGTYPHRLFLILPTRSLVDDQIERVKHIFNRLSPQVNRPLALVVDTGGQSYRQVWEKGSVGGPQHRHLYDGDVIITTLDKFLYRFFSFGEPFKNYIFPLRIHYGAKKPLFCFDEAHTYEDVAFTNFVNLIHTLAIEKGHDVVVMTATMPEEYTRHLNFLDTVDFINGENGQRLREFYQRLHEEKILQRPHEEKILEYHPLSSDDLVPALVEQAKQHYRKERRVIVTVELVKDAIEVYEKLRNEFGSDVLLYHGRIPDVVEGETDKGRTKIYEMLKSRDKNGKGYLLVTTSAIEVGCDLNAHTLVTELCNPDQLIQRAGRCNRNGQIHDARVIVIGNEIKEFLRDLDEEEQAAYIETLKAMHGQPLDSKRILTHLRVKPQMDYRVQKMFEMLYEYVYEANQVYKNVHEKGMVITRSWEPSITVCTGFDERSRPQNAVSVNLRSLIAYSQRDETVTPGCTLYRRYYEGDESHQMKLEEVTGGWHCAYLVDLYLKVPDGYFDSLTGYKDLPKGFTLEFVKDYREHVAFNVNTVKQKGKKSGKTKGNTADKENVEQKKAFIWYLRPLQVQSSDEQSDESEDSEKATDNNQDE